MKTSNYSKFSKLPQEEKDKYFPIAISNTVPSFFKEPYEVFSPLIPQPSLWLAYKDGSISEESFAKIYYDKLCNLWENNNLFEGLRNIEKHCNDMGKEPVLLCWCGKDKFCHRHILRDFLHMYESGIDIEEL